MRCPFCGSINSQVRDSRPADDFSYIRRRRVCPDCGSRFTTFEHVQLRDLMIIKKNGEVVPFDREKLYKSIQIAVRKRSINAEQIEKIVNGLVRQLESIGETEIKTEVIGEKVMESLFNLDKVSYIRYASVYKNFNSTADFEEFLKELVPESDKK